MRTQRALLLTAGFAAGFAGMTLELAAVRLLAPFFGTSAYVWTNVIAVTLLALALGAWIGGRVADRGHAERALLVCFGCAAALCLAAPLAGPSLAGELLPTDLRLDEAFALLVSGSLLATLAVFGPPLALIGACTPLLVRSLVDAGSSVGRGSGGIYAFSTLGSLLGTFGTTHWFVPYWGSRTTVLLAGASLIGGLACLLLRRRSVIAASAALLIGIALPALAAPRGSELLRQLPDGWVLVGQERESTYQSARVVEQRIDGRSLRFLQVNDGLDSFQSLREEGELFTDTYYDALAVAALATPSSEKRSRVLILGLGGGTLVPLLRELHGALRSEVELVGVEIDPVVVELAEAHLGLDPQAVEIWRDLDARVALRYARGPWDVVIVDAYAGQVHIPAHLCSREFFREIGERLAPGGVVALNVGSIGADDPVAEAVANTLAANFEQVLRWPVPRNRNEIAVAVRKGAIDVAAWAKRLDVAASALSPAAGTRARQRLAELRVQLDPLRSAIPHPLDPEGVILRDDDARIDVLQMEALQRAAAR
jgi:spermidine synthase